MSLPTNNKKFNVKNGLAIGASGIQVIDAQGNWVGATGSTKPYGATGSAGVTGDGGTTGVVGASGSVGEQGAQGISSSQGLEFDLANSSNSNIYSNGNTTVTANGGQVSSLGTLGIADGETKWFSVYINNEAIPSLTTIGVATQYWNNSTYVGATNQSVGFTAEGNVYSDNAIRDDGFPTWTTGDTVDIAVFIAAGQLELWIRVNGGYWNNNPSADPGTYSGGLVISAYAGGGTTVYPALGPASTDQMTIRSSASYANPTAFTFLPASYSVNTGYTGATGAQGVTGDSGIDGASGVTGETGVDGASGVTGETGVNGASGPDGVQGPTGVQGATGGFGGLLTNTFSFDENYIGNSLYFVDDTHNVIQDNDYGNYIALGTENIGNGNYSMFSMVLDYLTDAGQGIGIANRNVDLNDYLGANDENSVGFYEDGTFWYAGTQQVSGLSTFAAGDVIDIAVDTDNHLLWIRVNGGNWNNNPSIGSGNIVDGTGAIGYDSSLGGNVYPAVSIFGDAGPAQFTIRSFAQYTIPSSPLATFISAGVKANQGYTGATGVTGEVGATGPSGARYYTESSTTLNLNTGATGVVVIDDYLNYSSGQTILLADSGGKHIHATVDSYDAETKILAFTPIDHVGSGSSNAWVINLDGAEGAAGVSGVTGPDGVQGTNGEQGEQGTNFNSQGITGDDGAQGTDGHIGETGVIGPTGEQGVQGGDGTGTTVTVNAGGTSNGSASSTGFFFNAYQTYLTDTSNGRVYNHPNIMDVAVGWIAKGTGLPAEGVPVTAVDQGNKTISIDSPYEFFGFYTFTGESLYPTNVGYNGATGPTGVTGTTGERGDTGENGQQGYMGASGATGYTGATGVTGDDGVLGYTGASGATGADGDVGNQGYTGDNGEQGIFGSTGLTGSTGPTGEAGLNGLDGATGSDGSEYVSFYALTSTIGGGIGIMPAYLPDGVTLGSMVYIDNTSTLDYVPYAGMTVTYASVLYTVAAWEDNFGDNSRLYFTNIVTVGDIPQNQYILLEGNTIPLNIGATGITGASGPTGEPGADADLLTYGNPRGLWDSGTQYFVDDIVVTVDANSHRCLVDNIGFYPDSYPEYWNITAYAGASGASGYTGASGITGDIGVDGATGSYGNRFRATLAVGDSGYEIGIGGSGVLDLQIDSQTQDYSYSFSTGQTVIIYKDANNYATALVNSYSNVSGALNVTIETEVGSSTTSDTLYINLDGSVGPQGASGATGYTGATGPTGEIGDTGILGDDGTVGLDGATGVTGSTGPTGDQGSNGYIGATGVDGEQGYIGNTGDIGLSGLQGDTGSTGYTGPQGFSLVTGSTGLSGTSEQTIDQFASNEVGTAKYLIQGVDTSNNVQATEVILTQTPSGVWMTEYATLRTGDKVMDVTATTNGSVVSLKVTPVSSGTTFSWVREDVMGRIGGTTVNDPSGFNAFNSFTNADDGDIPVGKAYIYPGSYWTGLINFTSLIGTSVTFGDAGVGPINPAVADVDTWDGMTLVVSTVSGNFTSRVFEKITYGY